MKLQTFENLFLEELKDLFSAENQILKALPKLVKAASNPDLQAGFQEHLEQTKTHVSRLEQIFEELDVSPKGKKCKGMEGLLAEGAEYLEEKAEPAVLDSALIAAAQRVEHYEIAAYGCVRTFANVLGHEKIAGLLQETLDEEAATDRKLTEIAEEIVNMEAAAVEKEEE